MKCLSCKLQYPAGIKFCPKCGSGLVLTRNKASLPPAHPPLTSSSQSPSNAAPGAVAASAEAATAVPVKKVKEGVSPFAIVCFISGTYFIISFILLKPFFELFHLGSYAFALALLSGPLAWREIKEGKKSIKGSCLVMLGMLFVALGFFLKFLGFVK